MTNTNMSTQSSDVYQGIQEILGGFFFGIPLSRSSILEAIYQLKFNISLDYKSLGVTHFNELLDVMGDKVVLFEERESKEKYVMSAPMAKFRQQIRLKPDVEKLLYTHSGKIVFDSFEDFYKDRFKVKLSYGYYGLTDLDHLCKIFENILVVEEEKSSGKKVIKAVKGMYNLRKKRRIE